ncbi:TPA: non-canonical purine NTP pyrophosphatase, RdgB/HAM1 family [Candidatus Acetothermia bacterium]|nr:non-canonical purine NTP pyrophosphatase, RdgB/HAM1 family [Candidatus Acetothermia bacterium]
MILLLLGTKNEGKLSELRELLADLDGVELLTFHDRPFKSVEEIGLTFEENARLKARTIGAETGLPVLAEDTGLGVDALGGEPGVHSARFAGVPVNYERNNILLLERLAGVRDRKARFIAVAALRFPDGREFVREGILTGRIARKLEGEGGFGYDPLFIPEGFSRTLAEMTLVDKNRISHRRRAIEGIKQVLRELAHD